MTPFDADLDRVMADLARLEPAFAGGRSAQAGPFTSGWIGWMSYDLGGVLEPAAKAPRCWRWPLMVWHRVEEVAVHDASAGLWRSGLPSEPTAAGGPPASRGTPDAAPILRCGQNPLSAAFYGRAVARAIEYIRAGDVYQVNLAHTIGARLGVRPRAFAAALLTRAAPWYGAYIEHEDADGPAAVCSVSPELFLEVDPAVPGRPRRIVTRPMKGTLRGDRDPALLAGSAKDRAELDMIVDLMRNDMGRVCATGSVRVEDRRAIERHAGHSSAGVWQGVATVAGVLRAGTSLLDLLRAVFPAGSVTGAPKIRAMQIIGELEDRPRGPYCGCVGYIGDDGRVALNVAIRTALLEPARRHADFAAAIASPNWVASWSVGAGIVADSDPGREWEETLHKAEAFVGMSGAAFAHAEQHSVPGQP